MDLSSWNVVLVEWVNCLKLSKPIENIQDLKDGNFYTNLFNLIFKSTNKSLDALLHIKTFLKEQYPEYEFENYYSTYFEDLSINDLTTITSLLMFYTCCLDGREVLTTPLCEKLSQTTQLKIRTFFEKIDKSITYSKLMQIIEKMVSEIDPTKEQATSFWFSSGDSSNTQSPLQNLMKTPMLKVQKIQEKERELSHLRSQLELEQFEKSDLQEELKIQIEKNKKLDDQLKQKTKEIRNLRGEIVGLENRTPPHFQDIDSRQIQHRLRAEIESLEQYVSNIQEEQEILQNEKEASKEKIKKLEIQCMELQEKLLNSEKNNDLLSENAQKQEIELKNLKLHCNELTAMLDDLRLTKQQNESLIETDSTVINFTCDASYENLAHSVVEVQLQDAQNENLQLKQVIKETQEKSNILNEELINVKSKFANLEENIKFLQEDNQQLLSKVTLLKDTQNSLENTKQELSGTYLKLTKVENHNDKLKTKVEKVKKQLQNTNSLLNESQTLNGSLSNDLRNLQITNENLETVLKEKTRKCETLEKEIQLHKKDYDKAVEKYNNTSFEMESIKKKFEEFDKNVEIHLKQLENIVFENKNSNFSYEDKNYVFMVILKQMDDNKMRDLNNEKELNQKIVAYVNLINQLEVDQKILNEREALSIQEKHDMRDKIEIAQSTITLLQQNIVEYNKKIDEMNCVNKNLMDNIKELEKLKTVVEEKQNDIANLKENNKTLKEEVVSRKTNEEKLQTIIEQLEEEMYSLETILHESNQVINGHVVKENTLTESIKTLEQTKDDLEEQLSVAKGEIMQKENSIKKTLENLEKISKTELDTKNNELKIWKNKELEAQNSIINLKEQNCSLEEQLIVSKTNENELQENLFVKEKLILELNTQNEIYCSRIKTLEMEMQQLCISHKTALTEINHLKQQKEEAEESWKADASHLNKNIKLLKATTDKLAGELENVRKKNEELEKHLLKTNQNYTLINEEKKVAVEQKDELKKQLETLTEIVKITEQKCDEKDDVLDELNKQLLTLKLNLENKNQQITEQDIYISNLNAEISDSKSKIAKLKTRIVESEQRMKGMQKEIKILSNLKTDLEKTYKQLENTTLKILKEITIKNDELDKLIKKLNDNKEKMQKEINHLQNALTQSNINITALAEEKNILTSNYDQEISKLNDLIQELNKIIENYKLKEINYIQEIYALKDELSEKSEYYAEALQNLHEIKQENESEVASLTENLHSIVEKYNILDKKHEEASSALNILNQELEELQNKKNATEKQLVEQKVANENAFKQLNEELCTKIETLTVKEKCLNKQLATANTQLEGSTMNGIKLKEELIDLKQQLNKLQLEKTACYNELKELKASYQIIQDKYEQLQFEYDKYLKESEENLNKTQFDLNNQIDALQNEKKNLQVALDDLNDKIKLLHKEKNDIIKTNEIVLQKNETTKQVLETTNKEYEKKILVLIADQKQLEERILIEKVQYEELRSLFDNSEKAKHEHESAIAKLRCATEILEMGKNNLENECAKLQNNISKLEVISESANKKFVATLSLKDDSIASLTDKVKQLTDKCTEKETQITSLYNEIDLINKTLKLTTNNLNNEKVSSKQLENKLKEQEILFKNQVYDYKLLCKKINELEKTKNVEETKIVSLEADKQELLQETKEKTNKISEIIQQNHILDLEVQNKSQAVSELNTKIGEHLETISKLTNDKQKLENEVSVLTMDLQTVLKNRDEICEAQTKIIKETENNILRAHENAIEEKNDLLRRIELVESTKLKELQLKDEVEKLLAAERESKKALEMRVLELSNEKSKLSQLCLMLQSNMQKLNYLIHEKPLENLNDDLNCNDIETVIENIETKIIDVLEKKRNLCETIKFLESEKMETFVKIDELQKEVVNLSKEKEKLIKDYDLLVEEKIALQAHSKSFDALHFEHDKLQARYEQIVEYCSNTEALQATNSQLQTNLTDMQIKNEMINNKYQNLNCSLQNYKLKMDKLLLERNFLDNIINKIRQNLTELQKNICLANDSYSYKQILNKRESHEIIAEDIYKQSNKLSKTINELFLNVIVTYKRCVADILTNSNIKNENCFAILNIEQEIEKIEDLKETATNLLEKISCSIKDIENLNAKQENKQPLKENIQQAKINIPPKDEDLKKKNIALKQRAMIAENAKTNLERKIKQLRDENKKLSETPREAEGDENYKLLLRQHIEKMEENQKLLNERDECYKKLLNEYEQLKNQAASSLIKADNNIKEEMDELKKMREAYGRLMMDNSKYEMENKILQRKLENCTEQLNELRMIKEAYEKLLEENNKLMMEVDTIKYKRARDREEFARILKRNKDEDEQKENKRLQEIRSEYEIKLEKMKEKMVNLYKNEMDEERQRMLDEKNDKVYLLRTIEQLKEHIKEIKLKTHEVEIERDKAIDRLRMQKPSHDIFGSRESLQPFYIKATNGKECVRNTISSSLSLPRGQRATYSPTFKKRMECSSSTNIINKHMTDERKVATLPKATQMNVIEEITVSRRTSINSLAGPMGPSNMVMEDEADDFNNKYLTDLKEGRCMMQSGKESVSSRFSELAWRNSLRPPHLKSSYATELQFISPRCFKEDDIKYGNVDFNESMSTKLLPGEKTRPKKDIGTTSYKKPGPPTPSKNGGRVSLQGNEIIHYKEPVDSKTPKRTTPNRLKALFMGKNASARDNSESQSTTPRGKRLSIFRKPR